MNSDFWMKKWQVGDIRFHQSKVHPVLETYVGKFSPGTLFVPLCGKTLDMVYLSSKGHPVIGVELSPLACRIFFEENGIPFTETPTKDFILFESDRITLWCGDFFKLPQPVWDKISGIYDRAALVALPEEVRRKYAAEITERTRERVEILLIAFEYPSDTLQGPPFSVPEKEIRNLYQGFTIELLSSENEERSFKDHPTLKSTVVTETVYWLHKSMCDAK